MNSPSFDWSTFMNSPPPPLPQPHLIHHHPPPPPPPSSSSVKPTDPNAALQMEWENQYLPKQIAMLRRDDFEKCLKINDMKSELKKSNDLVQDSLKTMNNWQSKEMTRDGRKSESSPSKFSRLRRI